MHIVFDNLADLVFFQNGMLEPWFESKNLGDADQVLAYFAISKLGEPPIDGKTDTNPEGLTAAYGKWASAVAERLHAGGLSCKVKEELSYGVWHDEKASEPHRKLIISVTISFSLFGWEDKDPFLNFQLRFCFWWKWTLFLKAQQIFKSWVISLVVMILVEKSVKILLECY